ncbi:MAG: hypothetical protein V5B78_05040 [Desulfohalobiaceae bacterium]
MECKEKYIWMKAFALMRDTNFDVRLLSCLAHEVGPNSLEESVNWETSTNWRIRGKLISNPGIRPISTMGRVLSVFNKFEGQFGEKELDQVSSDDIFDFLVQHTEGQK